MGPVRRRGRRPLQRRQRSEAGDDVLLVVAGGPGEIVQVGHHEEANVPVYMVDFGVAVLGCFEEELAEMATAAEVAP